MTSDSSLLRIVLPATVLLAPAAHAQKWMDIGKTSSNNVVSVAPKTIKHENGMVSATVRVVFTPPVKTPRGMWGSATTDAMVNCAKRTLAAKSNTYFSDAKSTHVVDKSVNKIPGFGPVLNGSLGAIAVDYLCKAK